MSARSPTPGNRADLLATIEKLVREGGKRYPCFDEDDFLEEVRKVFSPSSETRERDDALEEAVQLCLLERDKANERKPDPPGSTMNEDHILGQGWMANLLGKKLRALKSSAPSAVAPNAAPQAPGSPGGSATGDRARSEPAEAAPSSIEAPGCAHCMSCTDPKCPARLSARVEHLYTKSDMEAACEIAVAAYKTSLLRTGKPPTDAHPPVPPNHNPKG